LRAAGREEAVLRGRRDDLRVYFDLLLAAAAAADVGQKLMELVTGDDMLETAAGTGQVTPAEKEFVGHLNAFLESYQAWTEFGDDPGEWGHSQLLDEGGNDAIGEEHNTAISEALELFDYGQVIADAIGFGDGTAAENYIEEHLGSLGRLVPDFALSKARQYIDVSRQWS